MYELCWRRNKRSLFEQRHVAENAGILHISNSGEGKGRVGGGKRLKDFKSWYSCSCSTVTVLKLEKNTYHFNSIYFCIMFGLLSFETRRWTVDVDVVEEEELQLHPSQWGLHKCTRRRAMGGSRADR